MSIIYLASQNKHKVHEIQAILGKTFNIRPCDELAPGISWDETGSTFRDNALIKAQAVLARGAHTVISDDSGLEVASLHGAPGVYSARYAGPNADDEANNLKLLRDINHLPEDQLQARFVCVICFLQEGASPVFFEGHCDGHLVKKTVGLKGFGYDPLFIPTAYHETFAELGDDIKNQISHRARALIQFKEHLTREF
ncbi:MAG: RdgB/HAM1 family non-canonical purine NTP pyrophosphatase [Chitinophagaceae bacterium]|nr:RdgB/HAM1 family non-canonical purine NTP pyrophosphatase [Oligoflexus sp.]